MHIRKFILRTPGWATALVLGWWMSAGGVSAQPIAAVDTSDAASRTAQLQTPLGPNGQIPQLYEGELEDAGPQYLLLPKPVHQWFNITPDFQTYRSSNAALAAHNTGSSDVNVLSIQALIMAPTIERFDTQIQPRVGFRYQSFWYGLVDGEDSRIGGIPAKRNDFMTYTPFAEALYQHGNIVGSTGVRYAAFTNDNSVSNGTFYQEWAPYWALGYQWTLAQNKTLLAEYDGDYRFTDTPSGGLQPDSWNDRTDHAFNLIYSYVLGRLVLQPSYRFQYADYTNSQRHRNDIYNTLSFTAVYYLTDWASVRAFSSYEWRGSSELGNNYENWNIGVGVNVSRSF